ncbi:MAG: hypothetical protein QM324_00370 [Bacteroidota bacterium]|jgi:hypothetical protein|nr:hypothetical protein [Bacteroidota bacterium]
MEKRISIILITLFCVFAFTSSLVAQNNIRGQLKVGAARIDVTIDEKDLPESSYGILDRNHARAIIFTNGETVAGFVNIDGNQNGQVVRTVSERLEKDLGIPAGNIIYSGTHCHAVGTVRGEALANKLYDVIREAYEKMIPAKVGFGNGVSYLNVRRDLFDAERGTWWEGPDYDGKSDKTVSVVYFESMEGKPLAVYYNYAMHAVLTGQLDMVTVDFPGKSEEYIERKFGEDFVAMFSSGAAGDQNPLYFQQTFDLRDIRIAEYAKRGEDISNQMPPGGVGLDRSNPEVQRLMEEQKEMAISYGQLLGEEVKYVIQQMRHFESEVKLGCARKTLEVPGRRLLNREGRAGYQGQYEDSDPVQIALALIMLDNIPVCGVAGEVYNQIAVRLKRESPYAFTFMTTVMDGMGARGGGYIPDDESYGAQVFEVLGSRYKQGYAETAIVEGLLGLIRDVTR